MEKDTSMNEQWRTIPGFSNYAVSDRKRVKNLTTGRIIGHPNNCTPGAKDVALIRSDEGKSKMFTKDRLHGMCFGYQPPTEPGEAWRESVSHGILVSNLGRLFSTWNLELMSPYKRPNGYLYIGGRDRRWPVHRLVAFAFVKGRDIFRDSVDHINEDKTDNRADNLRWCTDEENTQFYLNNHTGGRQNREADIAKTPPCPFCPTKSDF
jgi:hypothetical protein